MGEMMPKSVWDTFDEQPQQGQQPAPTRGASVWDTFDEPRLEPEQERRPMPTMGAPIDIPFSTEVVSAFADDPQVRIEQIAEHLGTDPRRIGMLDGKTVIYEPETNQLRPLEGSGIERFTAGLLSKAPTIAGATVGEIAGAASMNPALMVAAPTAGAMAGEYARQKMGEYMTGDPTSLLEIGMEGALGGAGGGISALNTNYAMRQVARDIAKLDRPSTNALRASAKKWGVELTPAEISNLPSLIEEQRVLTQFDETSDILAGFKDKQRGQLRNALDTFLDSIALEKSVMEGNTSGVRAAAKHIQDLKLQRSAKVKPYYKKAYDSGASVDTTSALSYLQEAIDSSVGSTKKKISDVRDLFFDIQKKDDKIVKTPITDIKRLDGVKREIDDLIGSSRRGGQNNMARILSETKDNLVSAMDSQSWDYSQARGLYSEASKPIEEAEEGVVGVISRLKDEGAKRAGKILFSSESSDPSTVLRARIAIQKTNPQAWNDLVRAHIDNIWESKIKDSAKQGYGIGGIIRKQIFGSDKQRKILRAALDKSQYEALDDLMHVMEASSRAGWRGSDTALKQQTIQRLKDEASGPVRNFVRTVFNPLSIPKKFDSALAERAYKKNLSTLANAIVDPKSQQELRRLRVLSKSEKYFRPAMTAFLLQTLGGAGQAGLGMMTDAPLREGADYLSYIQQNYPEVK